MKAASEDVRTFLRCATEELKGDREFMLKAASENIGALYYATEERFRKGVGGRGLATNSAQNRAKIVIQNCVLLLP